MNEDMNNVQVFVSTEPVQVKHTVIDPDHVVNHYWRNALYREKLGDNHVVIYTGGQVEVLNNQTAIRKYKPSEK